MRKITIAFLSLMLAFNMTYAGGIVTNTNQSAAWARMLVRDASTDIDAVYYNPAGLTKLADGFHFSINSQSIFQTQTVTNSFPYLNEKKYIGNVSAPIFPSVYAAYKTGKWAFSIGFNPIGGGGGAEFKKGLPSIEVPISSLVGSFNALGVTGYSANLYFKGTSVYWGLQAGVSYEVNDYLSLYLGARYVMAKNTYTGYVKDIKLNLADGTTVRADDFMNGVGDNATLASQNANGAGTSLQPFIDGGIGTMTFAQAVANQSITQEQASLLEGGLIQLGADSSAVSQMTISDAQTAYFGYSTQYAAQAAQLHAGASLMGDQNADVTQTGSGFAPIIGANITLFDEKVNVGIKYEFKTKMDLTNVTPEGKGFAIGLNPDGTKVEMFPNGAVTNADIPAMFSIGANVKVTPKLNIQGGFHTYFDSKTDWKNVKTNIGHNSAEYAIGLEYDITDNFLLSAGYLNTSTGVTNSYQSDLSYSLNTNTVGFGGAYKINDMLKLQFGGYYVSYVKQSIAGSEDVSGTTVNYMGTYLKNTWALSIGLDIAIGK